MAKLLGIKDTLDASNEVLAANGNEMGYEEWKAAMLKIEGVDSRIIAQMVMKKRVKLVLRGAVVGEKPDLRVMGGFN